MWQSTLFAGVAGLLTIAFRKNRAAVRFGLWLAASLKFLIPFSLLVGIGNQVKWPLSPAIVKPEVVSVVGQISQPFSERMQASNFEVTQHASVSKLPVVPNRLPVVLLYV